MIDEIKLAQMDRSEPLTVKECTKVTTCALSGCPLDTHSWCVRLPNGQLACPGCAGDRGWTLQ